MAIKNKLSVCTTVSEAISKECYLQELIESVQDIASEIIIINGDQTERGETWDLINSADISPPPTCEIKEYWSPWESRIGCMMGRIQRSLAIARSTGSYIMLLDSDEIIHEKDHDKIRKCLELEHVAYAWHTIHFYRDYNTVKIPGDGWYDYRANLFKNNSYIFDSHDSYSGYQGTVYATMENEERDRRYLPLINHADCKTTSIEVMHYGHVRSDIIYLQKTNEINVSYHPHYKDKTELMWDMSNTMWFAGTHPKVMKERIESF